MLAGAGVSICGVVLSADGYALALGFNFGVLIISSSTAGPFGLLVGGFCVTGFGKFKR